MYCGKPYHNVQWYFPQEHISYFKFMVRFGRAKPKQLSFLFVDKALKLYGALSEFEETSVPIIKNTMNV